MNKYEIIGIVGEGAYGVVYKAKCKESGDFGKCLFLASFDILLLYLSNLLFISFSGHQEIQRIG